MKAYECILPAQGIVPDSIIEGETYFLDEDMLLHGAKPDIVYGLFYHDSLKTSYAGLTEMSRMKEVNKDVS